MGYLCSAGSHKTAAFLARFCRLLWCVSCELECCMLIWLRSQGFKNTFTASAHPHTYISSETLTPYLQLSLTANGAKTPGPSTLSVTVSAFTSLPTGCCRCLSWTRSSRHVQPRIPEGCSLFYSILFSRKLTDIFWVRVRHVSANSTRTKRARGMVYWSKILIFNRV